MYGAFADAELPRGIAHGGAVLRNVASQPFTAAHLLRIHAKSLFPVEFLRDFCYTEEKDSPLKHMRRNGAKEQEPL